jgi:hypothetical protein
LGTAASSSSRDTGTKMPGTARFMYWPCPHR